MRTKQTGRKAERSELPAKNVMSCETLIVDEIKHNICDFLDGIESGCSFATFGVYSEAPLPDLFLQGYGPIPLPLTYRDICNICRGRTEGDDGNVTQFVKSNHGGSTLHRQWEMKSDNLLLRSPAWNDFVQRIAVKAAHDLGTKSDDGAVEAKLVKARIWASEASMPPHENIPNAVNSFGKLLVCLPAIHFGGHVLLSYDGKTEEFSTETSSHWGYSYIAWHSDVSLELKPLYSGHMLILEYDLVLPSPAKLPSLADMYSEKEKLRNLLATWNSAVRKESTTRNSNFPTLLAHVCDSIYKSKPLSFNTLQGIDRFRAAYLRDICTAFNMGLYIANLDRTLDGFCEDHCNDDDYYMSVENEDSIILTKVVDLDGNVVGSSLALDVEDNFIASDPFDEGPDREERDRNHGLVTYYYRRTVLVMIPSVAKAEWLPIESPKDRPNKRKRNA